MWVKAHVDRLDLAEQVLEGWEQIEASGDTTHVQNLRLIQEEIVILGRLREQNPQRVDDLIERFKQVAAGIRKKMD